MLETELRGRSYNKAAHRRALGKLLSNRSDPAIERKHQNISAILIELGFPYINGYKPLGNYQRLLFNVVAARVGVHHSVLYLVEETIEKPASTPTVDDILTALVLPPPPSDRSTYGPRDLPRKSGWSPSPQKVDYLAREAANQSLGKAGEEFVLNFETARLRHRGHRRLADRIEHVSKTRGDGLGYDVLSFEPDGRDRLIEVKTTSFGKQTPFYVTKNELDCSHERSNDYHLYRVFTFRHNPRLFDLAGPIDASCDLESVQYRARLE